MEKIISIKPDLNSLDKLYEFLSKESSFECSKEYDIWHQRIDTRGQIEKCILLKKSSMHAVKLYFIGENTIKANHIIPNKMMNAYFGKSGKARLNIFEIITEKIKALLLASAQNKAFEEMEKDIIKAAA